jgi:hypothetical protein
MVKAIQDRNDMRMPESREDRCFRLEALSGLCEGCVPVDRANGHDPVQAVLAGAIDNGQTTAPGFIKDVVTGQVHRITAIGSSK